MRPMNKPVAPTYPWARAARYRPRRSAVSIAPLLLMLVLLVPVQSLASDPFVGKIISIDSGSAPPLLNIVRAGKSGFAQARPGDALFVGDTVKTGPDVKAQIELSDKSVINMGPGAVLRVKGYLLNAEEAKRNYVLKAIKGVFRFIISKAFRLPGSGATATWKDSGVSVETTTAIAGVRGTDFFIAIDSSDETPKVTIAVLEGLVTARNLALAVPGSVSVGANQMTVVLRGMKPEPVQEFAQQLKDGLLRSTTPSDAKRTPTGDREGASVSIPGKYTKDDIARDIAAGVPLAEAMERATASGMQVAEMVPAELGAWTTAHEVVYTAVTEGYSARDVVASAINYGASLCEVIAAAVIGGAETRVIMAGAEDAGAPGSAVASCLAAAASNSSPVFDYTTPVTMPTVEEIVAPAPVILISGGGGVTPSTKKASPYKP
jgi:hypothetical protein